MGRPGCCGAGRSREVRSPPSTRCDRAAALHRPRGRPGRARPVRGGPLRRPGQHPAGQSAPPWHGGRRSGAAPGRGGGAGVRGGRPHSALRWRSDFERTDAHPQLVRRRAGRGAARPGRSGAGGGRPHRPAGADPQPVRRAAGPVPVADHRAGAAAHPGPGRRWRGADRARRRRVRSPGRGRRSGDVPAVALPRARLREFRRPRCARRQLRRHVRPPARRHRAGSQAAPRQPAAAAAEGRHAGLSPARLAPVRRGAPAGGPGGVGTGGRCAQAAVRGHRRAAGGGRPLTRRAGFGDAGAHAGRGRPQLDQPPAPAAGAAGRGPLRHRYQYERHRGQARRERVHAAAGPVARTWTG